MTGDLLQSDIDLAKRLIAGRESDAEIVVALGYRKIPREKAQRLIQDLRRGINVHPDADPTPSEASFSRAPVDAEGAARGSEPRKTAPSWSQQAKPDFPWFRITLLVAVVVSLAGIFLFNYKSRRIGENARSAADRSETNQIAGGVKIEIEAQAVRINGQPLSRDSALKILSGAAGSPTRTNSFEELTIYAFDEHGILLYAEKQTGKNSLFIYFEPVGGGKGAQEPFSGTLIIHGAVVTARTASNDISSIPRLQVSETAKNVFSGQSDGLALSFAYLKTPERLSLVQVDLQ